MGEGYLQLSNSVILSWKIARLAISPGEVGQNKSGCLGETLRLTRNGLLFSLYLFQKDTKRNILLFLTPNSQQKQKNKVTSKHCLKINFETVALQNIEILYFLMS